MKLTLLSTSIFLILASNVTLASSSSTYRGELNLDYTSNERYANIGEIGFKWYFLPVTSSFQKIFKKTIRHPLAESAFLEKASSLSVKYSLQHFDDIEEFDPGRLNIDTSGMPLNNVDELDLSKTRAAIEYFIPNSIFYVGIEYDRITIATTDLSSEDNDQETKNNQWGLTAGIMIADNFLLSTNYLDDKDYKLNCKAKYVADLGGGTALNFLADYTRLDDKDTPLADVSAKKAKEVSDDFLAVSADYYFNRTFSIGTGVLYGDETGYELRAQKFFSDAVSARVMFRTFEENNSYAIGLSARL